jgi:hypothetical protein
LEEKLGLIREFIKNKLEICFTVNVVRPVDIVPSGNILPPVDVKQPAKLPVTPKTSLVPTRNLSNKPQTSFNSKRPLQNITGTNLAPNYVEILSPKKKMLVFGDSYRKSICYSEKISTLGISGANSGNVIQKLVEDGAKLLPSSETAKIGTNFSLLCITEV